MQLPNQLIDFLEKVLISGLKLGVRDGDRFKKRFRENPERFLVSLILTANKDALDWGSITTSFTFWNAIGDKNLQEAQRLIEEWEKQMVSH